MEPKIQNVLKRMEKEDQADRKKLDTPREDRMFTLHPDSAQLLHILIESTNARKIIEVGVSHGYSTIWIAHAVRITGGHLQSIELNPRNIDYATRNLQEAGLSEQVDIKKGDARDILSTTDGPIDLIFMDCWESVYVDLLKLIIPILRPGGLLIADNVTPGHEDSDKYIAALHDDVHMDTISVPIGRNIEISSKKLINPH